MAHAPKNARALAFSEFGDPATKLFVHNHDLSQTSPDDAKALTVQYLASPMNPSDINQIEGTYPSKPRFTATLGSSEPVAVGGNEGVAKVISVGTQVNDVKIGDWVVPAIASIGTWRTHARAPRSEFTVISAEQKAGLSATQVGTANVNPITAWRLLKDFGSMKEGDWFVQNGANSGVGRAAIQLAKHWGLKSLNVVRRRESESDHARLVKDLKDLGADEVVTDDEVADKGFSDRVREMTRGGKDEIRLGLNCVGGKIVNDMVKVMAEDSHLVTYGGMSKKPITVPTTLLIFKNITFHGFWLTRWSRSHAEEKKETLYNILDLMRQGKLRESPKDEIVWSPTTSQETLVNAVKGTLEGYRPGKSVFVFKDT